MNAIKTLRAALLQHILFFRFEQTFGKDWWETVLLPHMRQEAMDVNPSPAGKTYFAALKRFGRGICPEDLDTSVISAVILYDPYFQAPPNQVLYSSFEIDTARKLHGFRNKTSHEENDTDILDETDRQTLRVLRTAAEELELRENDPKLYREILKAYADTFGLPDLTGDQQRLLELSAQLEEADRAYRWEIEKAIPIYERLAEQGVIEAQRKLLEICTHTVRYFDLYRAVELCQKYPVLSPAADELTILLHCYPNLIWGTEFALNRFRWELESGKLIQNAQLEQYILEISAEFPDGLLDFLHDKEAYFLIYSINPDLEKAASLVTGDGGQSERYLSLLLTLASEKKLSAGNTIDQVRKLAEEGYVPLIDFYARRAMQRSNDPELAYWINIGVRSGSAYCLHQQEREKRRMQPPAAEEPKEKIGEEEFREVQREAVRLRRKVDETEAKLVKYKVATGLMFLTIAAMILRLILRLIFHT